MSSRPCPVLTATCHWRDSAASSGRSVALSGTDGQVHVLERPLQRELGSEITLVHLVQFRVGDRRVQRTALDRLRQLLMADIHSIRQLKCFRHALDQDRTCTR
jgi:hypothetical protein